MSEHDYRHITSWSELNNPEGLDARLNQQEVAGEVPKRATLTGAHRSRMARDVAEAAAIDGPPSAEAQNRYGIILRASRLIRANADERGR